MRSLAEVRELATRYNVIPITKTLFAGTETPVGLYLKLCGERANTFLLESAEQGVWGRYSFIGYSSRGQLLADRDAKWISESSALPEGELDSKPIEALSQIQSAWTSAPTDFPLNSGLVGFIGWGLTSHLEKVSRSKPSEYEIPLYAFNQFDGLIVVDHKRSEIVIVSLLFIAAETDLEDEYKSAVERIESIEAAVAKPTPALLSESTWPEPKFHSRTQKAEFLNQVDLAKRYVAAGDVFQVVISQRFDADISSDALDVYRALRATNPSPYMYLLRLSDDGGDYSIVGSSPEALVKVQGKTMTTHPIAGSRPRGSNSIEDSDLSRELLADEKEKSEHLMLVDLARNDLLRVCQPSSVQVSEFMQVHRFSHVMHLVSTVEGELREDTNCVDALLATFPAGTLSGAPKPRALEIIQELEPADRGLFGGVVGYFDFAGNADLAIAIRTAFIRDGVARIQAGAGIVLDSVPENEYAETLAKASVVLRAVAAANAMHHG